MDGRRLGRRRRLLGITALAVYAAVGLGPVGGALTVLARDSRGGCGCGEGAACCGAACCAKAPMAATTDAPDWCAASAAVAPDAKQPALVTRCTCGQRDHQSPFARVLDAHVPALGGVGICPPPVTGLAAGDPAAGAAWRPEPLDRVPKPSRRGV